MNSKFSVRFWGVRGSIACPGVETLRYGGNTPCIEVRCGGRLLILDGGTGARPLGNALMRAGAPIDADILLSHCHIDHIVGLPFFAPFFAKGHRFRVWAGNLLPSHDLQEVMRILMGPPIFPIGIDSFMAHVEFRDFGAGEVLTPSEGVTLRTAPLDHPGGATGYRIEFGGRSLAYLTDTESRGDFDPRVVALARGAGLMIYDCTYTEDRIGSKAGWGHSTWEAGVRLADLAGAKTLCIFHHDPDHDDARMDKIAAEAKARRPGTIVAVEGALVEL
jgi:phosphoribosyl 1,2-cyclic phosphodiesterase